MKDYSENGSLDVETAITRLNTDIIGGKHPDLILFSELAPFAYINKDYLLDLIPLIDTDPELEREDIAILDKLLVDGSLYYLSSGFAIETYSGLYSVFGDATGWTLDKYLEIEKDLPPDAETLYNVTRPDFLRRLSARYLKTAVDWEAGSCDFDNAAFISILEAAARVRETPEPANPAEINFTYGPVAVAQGKRIAAAAWINGVDRLAYEEKMANCRLSFIGLPTVDGSCGSDIHVLPPVGICTQTAQPEAAWDFLKFMLKNVSLERPRWLPVYRPYLQLLLERGMEQEAHNGVRLTTEDVDRFLTLLAGIENVNIYDETILGIIDEEASRLFAGEKTAPETARVIQSRVQLYISEQQ